MINNATPKTDLEREALEAAVELLVRSRRFQLLETKDMQVLAEVLTGEALERFIPEGTSAQPVVGVPSKDDRIVIEVVTQKSPSTVDLRLCLLDGATVYRESADGQLLLENDEFGTAIIAIELTNTPSGWRISKDENTSVAVGVDTCAK